MGKDLWKALREMVSHSRPSSPAKRSVRAAVALQERRDNTVRPAGYLQMQQDVPRAGELPVDESFRLEDE